MAQKAYRNSIVTTLVLFFALLLPGQAVVAAGPAPVSLGTAGDFVILAKTGVSTTGAGSVVGDIGVSPAAASYITGFGLMLPSASAFSTSALVTGKVYAPGYAYPTLSSLTTAVLNMEAAYTDAMGRAPTVTELGAGNIGGLTLVPGVYKWSTGVTIPSNITLYGGASDTWIFQVAQDLAVSSGAQIILSGGAQASNVFWAVAGQATLGTGSVFNGTILGQTAIVLSTGAVLNGRALAQTAVTLDASTVAMPTAAVLIPAPATTPYTPPPTYTPVPIYGSAPTTTADTNAALQIRLNGLLETLRLLQTQAGQQGSSAPVQGSPLGQRLRAIAMNLKEGSRDNHVGTLQEFLISQNKGQAARALTNVGATAYFGALTRAALAEFQASVGISPALGNFGAITRAHINTHY